MEEELLEVSACQYSFGEDFDQFNPRISVCSCECRGNVLTASVLRN